MRQPTVIVTKLEDRVLAELVGDALRGKLGASVRLEQEPDDARLEQRLLDREADAVIVGLDDADLPDVCRRLLERRPTAVVVALTARRNGTGTLHRVRLVQHSLHFDDLGLDGVAEMIDTALRVTRAPK